jgi:hypothetical protein
VRRALIVAVLVGLMLPGCSSQERPEGIVERWLLALNQGAAGRAGRFAAPTTSRLIVPGYATADPGRLDVIEVGTAERTRCSFDVPFRVVDVDGHETRMFAVIDLCPTASPTPIAGVERREVPPGVFPSEGGSSFGTDRAVVWSIAAAIGLAILLIAEVVMKLVRGAAPVISSPPSGVGSERGGDRT